MNEKPQKNRSSTTLKSTLVFILFWVTLGLVLIGVLFFGSCQLTDKSNASISRGRPNEAFTLYLTFQTNELAFGHSGLHHPIKTYSFILTEKPTKGRTVYPPTKLTLLSSINSSESLGEITSGQIIVDMEEKMVSVSLKTNNGLFPGNRKYPITFVSN